MLSPKRNLVVCDQKLYVVTVANTVMSVVALALQSAVLILSKSYIAYLVTRILLLTVRDIWINRYADKKYPFLSKKIRPQKGYYRKISEMSKLYCGIKSEEHCAEVPIACFCRCMWDFQEWENTPTMPLL